MKATARVLLGAVYLVAILTSATTVFAADPPVVVGEVGTRLVGDRADLPKELRRALEREIANLVLRQVPRAKRFVLSASLVKLERQEDPRAVSCTVSVVLREKKS